MTGRARGGVILGSGLAQTGGVWSGLGSKLSPYPAVDRGTFSPPGPVPVPVQAGLSVRERSRELGWVPHASPKTGKRLWGGWGDLYPFDGFDPGEFRVLSPQKPTFPIQKAFFLRFCRFFVTTESATLSGRVQNLFAYYMKGWDTRTCTSYVSGECVLRLRPL